MITMGMKKALMMEVAFEPDLGDQEGFRYVSLDMIAIWIYEIAWERDVLGLFKYTGQKRNFKKIFILLNHRETHMQSCS